MDSTILNVDEDLAVTGSQRQKQARINNIIECLISMVRIGFTCLMESPQDRMNTTTVVDELKSIKNIHVDELNSSSSSFTLLLITGQ